MSKETSNNQESIGSRPAKLRILDKEVQLSCQPGEEDDLLAAAAYVDQSMRELRRRNTTTSAEKIAIVTAINTASELLKSRAQNAGESDAAPRLRQLNQKLADFLNEAPVISLQEPE